VIELSIRFIVNPCSGRGRGKDAIKIIENELEGRCLDFDIKETTYHKAGIELAKQAVKDGCSKIIAVGGDGTLNEVVTGILRMDAPYPKLGLIPAGTGNNLARSIGLPLKLKKACHRVINNKTMKIDIGQVNDRYFITSMGIGLNTTVADEANRNFNHLRGTIVYILATLKVMPEYQSVDLEVMIETGEKFTGEYLLLVVGNSKVYSKTLELIPEFSLDDGLLELCLVEKMSKPELMAKAPYFLSSRHQELEQVVVKKVKELRVKLKNTDTFHVDGEVLKGNDLKIKVLPQVLELII